MSCVDFPINLYCTEQPDHVETLDLCRYHHDYRKVYIVTDGQRKFVIKHCSNYFTDSRKITGWSDLSNAYNSIGIYCPAFIENLSGDLIFHYTEDQRDYYVYAEEYAKFNTAEQVGREELKEINGQPKYLADLMRSIGKVAKAHFDFLDWPTQFSILQPHSLTGNFPDETTLAAARFKEHVNSTLPEFQERMENILELFYKQQEDLRQVYSQLPTSCFQGDLNDTNILIDQNHQFVGVIDFNVCGKEPVLNYAVREALMHIEDSALFDEDGNELYFYNDYLESIRINSFMKNMAYIGECYEYSDLERRIFPLMFRYINSFWWEQVYAIKQNADNKEKVEKILDWVELQLTRDDICLP